MRGVIPIIWGILTFFLIVYAPGRLPPVNAALEHEKTVRGVSETPAEDRTKKIKPITPLQWGYMKYWYNPFWYGGPIDGGEPFDGPFGGFAPNPFARPTAAPTEATPSRHDIDNSSWEEVGSKEHYLSEEEEAEY